MEKSVFSGITRNSLSYQQILELKNGKTLHGFNKISFHKTFNDLNIRIKEIEKSVKQNNDKILVNNKYIPLNINLIDDNNNLKVLAKLLRGFSSI